MTLQVDFDHRVPLGLVHVEAHLVAQDARVVDEHVEPAELVDGLLHHRLRARPRRDAVVVRDRTSALGRDLVDDLLSRGGVGAFAFARTSEVVDHDRGALRREEQRVTATDTASGAGDDRYLAVEQTHCELPRYPDVRFR